MIAVNYSTVRENLKTYCDKAVDDFETIIITRKDDRNVVLMSIDEYNNLLENLKIVGDREYYEKLMASRSRVEKGQGIIKTIGELKGMEE